MAVSVIDIDKLDVVRQLAGLHESMDVAFFVE